ncbi:MAG TPA: glycosyltransferase family 4 protein [Phototrophicaceae bacterium]|nr:glycosyltransferase family 4 protein [Phototrophicaceae bacterium]
MKILLISRCPPYPLHLGDRLILYHLAEELEARHHQLDLLAFYDRPTDLDEQGRYDHRFNHVELIPEPHRTQGDYLRRTLLPNMRFPRRAEQAWSPAMWQAIEARLKAETYDVVHLFGGVQVYEYARALRGLPAMITPYESYSLYLRRVREALTPSPSPSGRGGQQAGAFSFSAYKKRLLIELQFRLARGFEAWMFTPYRRVVVVSEQDREELLDINPTLPVEVIPNGVDLYHFRRARVKRKAPALLFVGNYEYAPNVDAALRLAREILPQVQKRQSDVKLWLVGNAPTPELQALAGDTIHVTGRVPDVRPYLARAAAFVCPLRLGAGIKNKVLEALAIGCPVIATPLSLDGIAVEDGHSALIADGDELVAAIVRLLGDATLAQQLADHGRALVEKQYSWDAVAERYEELYATISRQV